MGGIEHRQLGFFDLQLVLLLSDLLHLHHFLLLLVHLLKVFFQLIVTMEHLLFFLGKLLLFQLVGTFLFAKQSITFSNTQTCLITPLRRRRCLWPTFLQQLRRSFIRLSQQLMTCRSDSILILITSFLLHDYSTYFPL